MNRLYLAAGLPLLLAGACERVPEAEPEPAETVRPAGTEPAEAPEPGAAAVMDAELSIAENLAASGDLTMFNRAVEAAGLAETLAGIGPYTLFAPSDSAFEGGDAAAAIERGGPELVSLVSNHLVPGVVTAEDLRNAIERGDGSTELATMTGATLTVTAEGEDLVISSNGSEARVTRADLGQANGMVHVVDGVLEP